MLSTVRGFAKSVGLGVLGLVFVVVLSSGLGSVLHGDLGVYGTYGHRVTWDAIVANPVGFVVAAGLGLGMGAWRVWGDS